MQGKTEPPPPTHLLLNNIETKAGQIIMGCIAQSRYSLFLQFTTVKSTKENVMGPLKCNLRISWQHHQTNSTAPITSLVGFSVKNSKNAEQSRDSRIYKLKKLDGSILARLPPLTIPARYDQHWRGEGVALPLPTYPFELNPTKLFLQ